MTTDYKSSVFLPKTDFPMRGGLPKKEPELLKRWADMRLFERQRAESKGRPKFVLHDGPPSTLEARIDGPIPARMHCMLLNFEALIAVGKNCLAPTLQ